MVHEHLLNEKEFWLAYPVASYAKTEPDYYQGSLHKEWYNWRTTDLGTDELHDLRLQGLMRYGFRDEAKQLADRLLEMALVKNRRRCANTTTRRPV